MECTIGNLPYVGKNETPFNIRKDVKDLKAILADNHFQKSSHRFNNKLIIFTIIDRLTNTKIDKEILRKRLIQRENFR